MSDALPRGARLGVDVGKARIGLAGSDPDGLVATPVETVARVLTGPTTPDGTPAVTADVARIAAEAADRSAAVVYVGLPRHLSGNEGAATTDARGFAGRLAHEIAPVPVFLVDERMTTVTAHAQLRAAGQRTAKHRPVIDQAAAVIILQHALDVERASGDRAGEHVDVS
ncbi:Holliday junction resolvase RuvX [Isoptericola aurantiacus]|uniref:Holliday junction resolvase RuvX n=1 Tax=Isoptericola aurantiacus TaxID=3377839 RepID=UPI00383AC0DC